MLDSLANRLSKNGSGSNAFEKSKGIKKFFNLRRMRQEIKLYSMNYFITNLIDSFDHLSMALIVIYLGLSYISEQGADYSAGHPAILPARGNNSKPYGSRFSLTDPDPVLWIQIQPYESRSRLTDTYPFLRIQIQSSWIQIQAYGSRSSLTDPDPVLRIQIQSYGSRSSLTDPDSFLQNQIQSYRSRSSLRFK